MQCCFLPKRASRELYQYYVICSIRKSIERTPPEGEIGCEKACGYRERTEKQLGCVKMLQDKVKSNCCDGRKKCHEYAFTTRKMIYFNLRFVTVERMFQPGNDCRARRRCGH